MRWIGGVLGGLLALLVSPASAASAACQFRQVAELPVTLYGARALRPEVGATIDGVGANLIFDTGGAFIGLSQASATRLKLHPTAPPPGFQMRSYGQIVQAQVATAHRLAYGGVVIASPEFLIIDRAPSEDVDGFLGEPAFADVDIEIDLADRVIRLFQPAGCAGENLAYWADQKQVSVVDLEPFPKAVRPLGWVEINGVRLRALFDTGAPDTDLTADAAKRAGVRPGDLGVHEAGTAGGLGPGGLKNWQGHFQSLTIGKETIPDLVLNFTDKPNASADLIIGADYFVTHRVLISKSQGKLYSTPVGQVGYGAQPKPSGSK
jgi:predicted aspartyl protease